MLKLQPLIFFVLLIGICSPINIFGQVVNVEQKRLDGANKWLGSLSVNVNYTQNTKKVLQFGNRAHLQYNVGKHTFLVLNDINLARADEESFVNSGFQHVRYNFKLSPQKWNYETFGQHQYNKLQKIDKRLLGGGGLRYSLFSSDTLTLNIGSAAMYEYEEISDTSIINTTVRSSNYISATINTGKSWKIITTTYIQPSFVNFADYRVSSEETLELTISSKLAFKLIASFIYDTYPPEGVPNLNYYVKNALSFKL